MKKNPRWVSWHTMAQWVIEGTYWVNMPEVLERSRRAIKKELTKVDPIYWKKVRFDCGYKGRFNCSKDEDSMSKWRNSSYGKRYF